MLKGEIGRYGDKWQRIAREPDEKQVDSSD